MRPTQKQMGYAKGNQVRLYGEVFDLRPILSALVIISSLWMRSRRNRVAPDEFVSR